MANGRRLRFAGWNARRDSDEGDDQAPCDRRLLPRVVAEVGSFRSFSDLFLEVGVSYFPFYPGDYQRDTSDLSLAEHGAYLILLCAYYSTGRLPAELQSLHRICRAMSKDERAAVSVVAQRFFPVNGNGERHNKRADAEIESREERAEIARANGARGGRPKRSRSKPSGLANDNPAGYPAGTQRGPQQEPSGKANHIHREDLPFASANGADGEAEDPAAFIFGAGLRLLTSAGNSEPSARAFLGKLRKQAGDGVVAAAVFRACEQKPSDPKAWLHAACVPKPRGVVV